MMSATKPKRDRTEIETIEDPRVFSETEDTRKVTKKKSKVITEDAIFELPNKRKVVVSIYKENVVINLREYYEDKMTGEVKPGNKGISLTVDQWKRLHEQADEIDGAVRLSSDKDKIFRLGDQRKVVVSIYKNKILVNIREFYEDKKTGEEKAGSKGLALNFDQWMVFKRLGYRGIGLGIVTRILQTPSSRVIATCRAPSTAIALSELVKTYGEDRLIVLPLDVTDHAQHLALRESLRQCGVTAIDIVIANAGVMTATLNDPATTTQESEMTRIFQTNVIGVMFTFQTLQDLVLASSTKLFITLSSSLGSITQVTDTHYAGTTAYRVSKTATNMYAACFINDPIIRQGSGKMICLHPGWVQTDMGNASGVIAAVTIEDCTKGIMHILETATVTVTKQERPVQPTYEALQKRLEENNIVFVDYKGDLVPW